jgi:hypothetical protein
MWLAYDLSSEYALEIVELGVYHASIYNWIIVLKTAETMFFTFHSLINIPVSESNSVFSGPKKNCLQLEHTALKSIILGVVFVVRLEFLLYKQLENSSPHV